MIHACFESGRSAAVSGAYQYDTGQRIRLRGLPSPEELAGEDDFLSGDIVAVQAQYSFAGDAQTETRIATWDEEEGIWTAAVPDTYLTRNADVHVYIYVGYGSSEESSRAKTIYEAVFRPIARPAPGDTVTPAQLNAWDALVEEINLSLSGIQQAVSESSGAASEALAAADKANQAAEDADAAADSLSAAWDGATASAETLAAGSAATVTLEDGASGARHFTFGIPKGQDGAKGDKGDKGDTGAMGPAGVTFRLDGAVLYIDTDFDV